MRVRAYELDRQVEDKDVGRPRQRRAWATATVLGACLLAGGACIPFPQNPAEFKRAVQQGGSGAYLQERTISRGFDAVFSGMSQNAERCLNVIHTSTTPGRYGPVTEVVYYRATISKVTVYAGRKLGEIAARISAWAEGNETACPEL